MELFIYHCDFCESLEGSISVGCGRGSDCHGGIAMLVQSTMHLSQCRSYVTPFLHQIKLEKLIRKKKKLNTHNKGGEKYQEEVCSQGHLITMICQCGSRSVVNHESQGAMICTNCGIVLEENSMVNNVEFSENAGGGRYDDCTPVYTSDGMTGLGSVNSSMALSLAFLYTTPVKELI